jgi:hypothetical protein
MYGEVLPFHFLFYAHMGRFRSLILCSTPIGEVLTLYFMFYVRMGRFRSYILCFTPVWEVLSLYSCFTPVWGGSAAVFCDLLLYGEVLPNFS